MLYKTVSVKNVIAKVFSDLDLTEGTHRISDMITWAGEALEKIGAFPSLVTKVTGMDDIPLLEVTNYQAVLPYDFHRLVQVAYSKTKSGPFYPVRYATGSFDTGSELTKSTTTDVVNSESALVTIAMSLYDLPYAAALAKMNSEPAIRAQLNALVNAANDKSKASTATALTNNTSDYTYLITPNHIKMNQKDGYIMLSYQAVPTDGDGYPLIPDDQSYMEALYWYITMKLMYPEWRAGRVRDAVYYDARRSWNFYCKQAYGNALLPNKDQLESIKNTWLRLVPEVNEHQTSFSTIGQRQIVYTDNR